MEGKTRYPSILVKIFERNKENEMRRGIFRVLFASLLVALYINGQGTFVLANEEPDHQESSFVVYPSTHMFEGVKVGNSLTQVFTLVNEGSENLSVGTVSVMEEGLTSCREDNCPQIDSQSFIIREDHCSGQTLISSRSCSLEVAFSPVSEGLKTAYLSIPLSDAEVPQSYVLLSGSTPQLIDSEASEVVVSIRPNQLISLRCKTEPGQKIWVLINLPSIDPDFWFVRPSDAYCAKSGHSLSLFSQYGVLAPNVEELYYHDAYPERSIDLGTNDFTGLGKILIVIKKGDSADHLETVQTVRIVSENPAFPAPSP